MIITDSRSSCEIIQMKSRNKKMSMKENLKKVVPPSSATINSCLDKLNIKVDRIEEIETKLAQLDTLEKKLQQIDELSKKFNLVESFVRMEDFIRRNGINKEKKEW